LKYKEPDQPCTYDGATGAKVTGDTVKLDGLAETDGEVDGASEGPVEVDGARELHSQPTLVMPGSKLHTSEVIKPAFPASCTPPHELLIP